MEAVRFSETSEIFYQTLWRHIAECDAVRSHHLQNITSYSYRKTPEYVIS